MRRSVDDRLIMILLAEDDPGDVRLAEEALRESAARIVLRAVRDGGQALAYLRREGEYADGPRPDLILLDPNLLGKDGREVLAEIKQEDGLGRIPVVVPTASKAEEDLAAAYDRHANYYIRKPADFHQFTDSREGAGTLLVDYR